MDICFQKQKTRPLYHIYNQFQNSSKWKNRQSLHCSHALLKINKYKAFISEPIQDSLKISTDLNFLCSGLYTVQNLQTCNRK